MGVLRRVALARQVCRLLTRPTALRLPSPVALPFVMLLLSVQASAATYYVDPGTGSDANVGSSPSAPWESVPGSRTADNLAFLRSQWGAVSQTNKIKCGDTILLKGGATYSSGTVANGGALRIDPSYYTSTCAASSPITIQVATNAQWAGSVGPYIIDGRGMIPTSLNWTRNGPCDTGGYCALVDIEHVSGVIFTGTSAQQIAITHVQQGTGAGTAGIQVEGTSNAMDIRHIQLGWLDITGKSSYDKGYGIEITDLTQSWVHDVIVHDWLGGGIDSSMQVASHRVAGLVLENIVVARVGNSAGSGSLESEAFRLGGGVYSDTAAGGGTWMVRCASKDNLNDGLDAYGCNSSGQDGILRIRDSVFAGNGRNLDNNVPGFGMESAGDSLSNCYQGSGNKLPEQTIVTIRSVFYNNRRGGLYFPHNAGSHYAWHDTLYRSNNNSVKNDHCQSSAALFNSIVDPGSGTAVPFADNNCGTSESPNNTVPIVVNTLFRAQSATDKFSEFQSLCTSDNGSSWTGTKCKNGGCPAGQTCRTRLGVCGVPNCPGQQFNDLPGFVGGGGNIAGTVATNFVSTAGKCDTAFNDGAPGFADCDFHLQPSSPAIDPSTPQYVLLADGAGSGLSRIAVKASTPEPEQVRNPPISGANYATIAGGLNWGARPHIADPRTYFLSPQIHPWATGDVIQIVGTCANGLARHGAAGRAQIVSMTSNSITLDDTCTWADGAGVHWPWSGTAPDMGAYEFGLTDAGPTLSPPTLISVEPVQTSP